LRQCPVTGVHFIPRWLLTLAVLVTAFLVWAAPAPALAQKNAENFRESFSFEVFNECEGEYVLVEGEYHRQSKVHFNKKTGATTFEFGS